MDSQDYPTRPIQLASRSESSEHLMAPSVYAEPPAVANGLSQGSQGETYEACTAVSADALLYTGCKLLWEKLIAKW